MVQRKQSFALYQQLREIPLIFPKEEDTTANILLTFTILKSNLLVIIMLTAETKPDIRGLSTTEMYS